MRRFSPEFQHPGLAAFSTISGVTLKLTQRLFFLRHVCIQINLRGNDSGMSKTDHIRRDVVFKTLVQATLRGLSDLNVDFRGTVRMQDLQTYLPSRYRISYADLEDLGKRYTYFRFMQSSPERDPLTCGMIVEFDPHVPQELFEEVIFTFLSRLCWSHVVKRQGGNFLAPFDHVWELTPDLCLPINQLLRSTCFAYSDHDHVVRMFRESAKILVVSRNEGNFLACRLDSHHPDTQEYLDNIN